MCGDGNHDQGGTQLYPPLPKEIEEIAGEIAESWLRAHFRTISMRTFWSRSAVQLMTRKPSSSMTALWV